VGNCAKLYAPDPTRLDCTLGGFDAAHTVLRGRAYQYLIVPVEWMRDTRAMQAAAPRRAEWLWNDSRFAVYRLKSAGN
jgi:hypothetical protein